MLLRLMHFALLVYWFAEHKAKKIGRYYDIKKNSCGHLRCATATLLTKVG